MEIAFHTQHSGLPVHNKMDQEGTDRIKLMEELRRSLDDGCIDFGDLERKTYEHLAMSDESAMETYLATGKIGPTDYKTHQGRKVFPCFLDLP